MLLLPSNYHYYWLSYYCLGDIFNKAEYYEKILDAKPNEIGYIIGTVYIEMAHKPSILEEITKDVCVITHNFHILSTYYM